MISIEQSVKGFSLYFKGREILRHRPYRPCLRLGRGQGRFAMSHGSFTIREKRPSLKALRRFEVQQQAPDAVDVLLGGRVQLRARVVDGRLELGLRGDESATLNRCVLDLVATAGEHIYGCGEQYSRLDLKGSDVPLWVEEQGVGRGKDLISLVAGLKGVAGDWYTTYFPQPTFVSSRNYFCHVETSAYARFDFTRKDIHRLYLWSLPERIIMDVAPKAPVLLESLTSYLGRQPALPDWVYDGMWLGIQGGEEMVRQKVDRARASGVKVSGVWVQDWVGPRVTAFGKQLRWNWVYDQKSYPNLPREIDELKEDGVRFLGYINCFLATDGSLYEEAKEKGYLVKNGQGDVYHVYVTTFPAAILDLTNPDTRQWIKGVIKSNMLDVGLSGWMADFGEYLPVDAQLWSGESAEQYHNRYPQVWADVNREALAEAGRLDDVVFFSRAGYTGSSRATPLIWAGDQLVNWSLDDGLASVIPAGLSLGFTGIGHFHSDIGGYTTFAWVKRKKELFQRWAEVAAFSPVMRSHEGNRPDANWQFDSDGETLRHLAKMTRMYAALKPYLKHAAQEYQDCGLPLMRHPYVHYEQDPTLHKHQYQYLLGRDLFVAPVYLPGREEWKVYLPPDEWVHLWSGEVRRGGSFDVAAPLGEPPVFYRRESTFGDLFREAVRNVS
jgi:alpha-glucosidase